MITLFLSNSAPPKEEPNAVLMIDDLLISIGNSSFRF